ncbi:type 3 dihydrofolate reductase [Parashewanella spongiae]|uniref:Dihydrofolate reductase n=1 Tax=Parashewanella spongiae TaxID=342950 RepID=A0A3A6TR40_9GAMM|nr:type 3 dihydrofolate reductase [Parashewanella spongiae]MCL1076684.1 type 3 dihydrofolate reductase [Parashewanella spongiae]RJY18492.1 type 3 dihydrofolate reductase [Parashewanella spongiae]
MQIAMIAAMTVNRVIGKDNKMPWHLPEDLKHFKAMTMNKPIVMGRKTFESIGSPLPGRHNIVISRQPDYAQEGISVVSSFEQAKELVGTCDELVVIGGGQLYEALLPQADKLYLTQINIDVAGDTYFPYWDDGNWLQISCTNKVNDKGIEYRFLTLVKKC